MFNTVYPQAMMDVVVTPSDVHPLENLQNVGTQLKSDIIQLSFIWYSS